MTNSLVWRRAPKTEQEDAIIVWWGDEVHGTEFVLTRSGRLYGCYPPTLSIFDIHHLLNEAFPCTLSPPVL